MPFPSIIAESDVVLATDVLPIINNWRTGRSLRQDLICRHAISYNVTILPGVAIYECVRLITRSPLALRELRVPVASLRIRISYLRILLGGSPIHFRGVSIGFRGSGRGYLVASDRSRIGVLHVITALNVSVLRCCHLIVPMNLTRVHCHWSSLNPSRRKVSLPLHGAPMAYRRTFH